ncbi:hypothetical protein CAAN1_20S00254 [[Candida] anglica]|uniref:Leucine-rich repeat-containing protein n=1 Tax=[Candida] anglica TaxID=148631 RepID=A0ABP0EFU9_9ASCO
MGAFTYNENSIEGEIFIQRLSTYIRRNEESLANGLVCFSKNKSQTIKPLRLSFTMHHLYYVTERIDSSPLGVDIGPLNVKLDNPNHEPTFISFMANNARSSRHFESDARSISSINSMKSIVSSASMYWRSVGFSKDPKVINKDLKYLYSSFTKIPCLIMNPKTKMNSISGYEEYPCDTSVPLIMFKNLQVLEMIDYDPNEIYGWHVLSEQLRILIIKNSKISDIGEIIFNLVIDDETGRTSFNNSHKYRKNDSSVFIDDDDCYDNGIPKFPRRDRTSTIGTNHGGGSSTSKDYHTLPERKWALLKQLTISEASITTIPSHIFKPLSNLVKLNLSNNLMESIPNGLDKLENLKYLNLADNILTDLTNLPSNLNHLSTLNLNNNKLTSLEGFNNLSSLEKVDLRRNNLKDLTSLKPIVLQFIKNPEKFNNVYLANNSLPKNFRIDLFNLFNGIKYKNQMKIDDSRPGYFESALLLDSESAFKAFEKFFGLKNQKNATTNTSSTSSRAASISEIGDITSIIQPLASVTISSSVEEGSLHNHDKSSVQSTPKVAKKKKSTSPLSPNHNLTNTTSSTEHRVSTSNYPKTVNSLSSFAPPSNIHMSPNPGMKKSPTISRMDTPPPGIITPIQVTARMST